VQTKYRTARRAVTQRDVAAAAGVSTATVSRVLAGDAAISRAVSERVIAESARLRYRPNRAARALRRQRTQTIGIVVPRLSNPFFPALVEAIEAELHDAGYSLMLCDSHDDPARERERIEMLIDRQIDGLLVIPCDASASVPALEEALAGGAALVQVDRAVRAVPADRIGVDNELGVARATAYLVSCGRTTIAFVGAEPTVPTAALRLHAFEQALPGGDGGQVLLGDFSRAWGREAAGRLLAGPARPDAVLCANDLIAFGVLEGLAQAGVAVPDEVAVIGFDDTPFAALTAPPLTSIRQPVEELAAGAVRLLLERMAEPDRAPRRIDVAPELSIRRSTPPPPEQTESMKEEQRR
jgi:LacI family transcriptional regulator